VIPCSAILVDFSPRYFVAQLNLTRREWKRFKDDNNLSDAGFFKKANVGPLIDEFHKMGERWHAEDGDSTDGRKFLKAIEKLQKAFGKFIKNKAAKQELSREVYQQIVQWRKDLEDVGDELVDFMRLHAKSGGNTRDAEIMSRKLDKMFNF
jgi:hypothetical protein